MDIKEIIGAFSAIPQETFPKKALKAAIAAQEELTPMMLEFIQRPPEKIAKEIFEGEDEHIGNFQLDFYFYLLALFREQKAFPLILEFYSYKDQDLIDELSGDFITESLASILASTFDGNIDQLIEGIYNTKLDEFIRDAFLRTSVILVMYGDLDQEEMKQKYIDLIDYILENPKDPIASIAPMNLSDLADADLLPHIKKLYQCKEIDSKFLDRRDLDSAYDNPPQKGDRFYRKVDNIYAEIGHWVWFNKASTTPLSSNHPPDSYIPIESEAGTTYMRANPKLGRNDPCFCGSGKKYKKCCLK